MLLIKLVIDVEFENGIHCSFEIFISNNRWDNKKDECWEEIRREAKKYQKSGKGEFHNVKDSKIKSIHIEDFKNYY